jgi:hypothetical protein
MLATGYDVEGDGETGVCAVEGHSAVPDIGWEQDELSRDRFNDLTRL